MPLLREQHTRIQEFTAVLTVLHLLTPLTMWYGMAKKLARLCTKMVEELPEMQRDY